MNHTEELKAEIVRLNIDLEYARKHTYIGETNTLHAADGELIIGYGNDQWLTIATDQLFQDLPAIINLVCLEQVRMQESTLQRIKDEVKEL